jgi:hypothetical protein
MCSLKPTDSIFIVSKQEPFVLSKHAWRFADQSHFRALFSWPKENSSLNRQPRQQLKGTPHYLAESFRPGTRYLLSASISTADGSCFPNRALADLCKAYASFNLKAVGMNSKSAKLVNIWGIAFSTLEPLQEFILKIERSYVDGKRLKVILVTGIKD